MPDKSHLTTKLEPRDYGRLQQMVQLSKYRERLDNHWRHRIELAHRLVDTYSLPRLGSVEPKEITVLDVGCSIGTFALEFARDGFRSIGVDFDASALEIARDLASEEGLQVEWICEDVTRLQIGHPVEIVIMFDLLEHLKDDEIGVLLAALRSRMSASGSLVFHTFPSQYSYLFGTGTRRSLPLVPFRALPHEAFSRVSRAYAGLYDVARILVKGGTVDERRQRSTHNNPLTPPRVLGMFERAGFDLLYLDSAELFPDYDHPPTRFRGQPITHRNIFGVACPASR